MKSCVYLFQETSSREIKFHDLPGWTYRKVVAVESTAFLLGRSHLRQSSNDQVDSEYQQVQVTSFTFLPSELMSRLVASKPNAERLLYGKDHSGFRRTRRCTYFLHTFYFFQVSSSTFNIEIDNASEVADGPPREKWGSCFRLVRNISSGVIF